MTPSARLSAAIQILDRWLSGTPVEQALTNWARASRFAGSGDRHAVRDLVFDAIRCRRSFAAAGGGETGRGLILGSLRTNGADFEALFSGEKHAPAPLGDSDAARPPEGFEAFDLPDWLGPVLMRDHGRQFGQISAALRQRAPVFLRVNLARVSRDSAIVALAQEGIEAEPHALATTALRVVSGARRIQGSEAYNGGLVELQDAASQAVIEALPLAGGMKVLDYCAGGGGKTLAMAARAKLSLFAHDAEPRRMSDLPARAARAGTEIRRASRADLGRLAPFDLVLTDVPCSGSGSWRRAPEAKWALTPARLSQLNRIQDQILSDAARLVRPGGWLAYATCSLLSVENEARIVGFIEQHRGWSLTSERRLTPLDGGDGFYIAVLQAPAR